jgi:hypothetical protein
LKSFFKSTFLYGFILLIVLAGTLKIIQCLYQSRSWNIENRKIGIAFIGDSHFEQSINDRNYQDILNFAQSGDAYIYTLYKMIKLLKDNPAIDTVVLSIDCHNMDKTCEEWYSNQSYIDFKFPKAFPFFEWEDFKTIYKKSPVSTIKAIPNFYAIEDFLSNHDYLKNYGGYVSNETALDTSNLKSESKYLNVVSELQLNYLNKIVKHCKQNNIHLILVTAPIHSSVKRNSFLNNYIEDYAKQNQLKYCNFRNYNLSDSCFFDVHHLNKNGAKLFSSTLIKSLRNN